MAKTCLSAMIMATTAVDPREGEIYSTIVCVCVCVCVCACMSVFVCEHVLKARGTISSLHVHTTQRPWRFASFIVLSSWNSLQLCPSNPPQARTASLNNQALLRNTAGFPSETDLPHSTRRQALGLAYRRTTHPHLEVQWYGA